MKKNLILFCTISFLQHISLAQCPQFPAVTGCAYTIPNCEGIDGYCNTLIPQTDLTEALPGCGGTAVLNNDDWISFFAGTETITIRITPSNCQSTDANVGIQAGIYAMCDDGGGANGDGLASGPLAVQCGCTTTPLTLSSSNYIVGQIYYLVIDGCGGDICDYEIEVLEGSTASLEITAQIGDIQGDTSFCSGDIAIFSIDSVENATFYNWTVDSTAIVINGQGTPEVDIEILAEGNIELCVTGSNGCYTTDQSCLTISSMGEIQTTTIVEAFCEGDSIEFEGEYYSETGVYTAVYDGINGCDSILNLVLTVYEAYDIQIEATICEGDSFEFGDSIYSESGIYENMFLTVQGCDSIINLNLDVAFNYETVLEDSICENETYPIWGDELIAPGVYTNALESIDGCDSIVTLTLGAISTFSTSIDTFIEPGGIYNGVQYENDTSFVEILMAENGCDSTVTTNIMVNPNAVVLPTEIDDLKIFPNPASNQIFIQFELNETLEIQFGIFNTLGQKVLGLNSQTSYFKGKHTIELDAMQLTNGTYFLQFKTKKWSFVQRFVIAR